MKTLPESIGSCFSLQELQANGDSKVPLCKFHRKTVSVLDIIKSIFSFHTFLILEIFGDNLIEDLPASVCNLIHLKSLSLNNNNVSQIPPNLLIECKALQNISLHDNPISMEQLQQMEGFQEFEARKKKKFDKQIDSNVMIDSKGLDVGVDL